MTNRFRIVILTPAQKAIADRTFGRKVTGRSFFATAGAALEYFDALKTAGLFIRSEERPWVSPK